MQQQQEKDFTRRLDAGLWLRLAGYIKPYRRLLLISAATLIVSALCDTLFPLLTREALDRFVIAGQADGLAGFAARYAAAILVQAACIFANSWLRPGGVRDQPPHPPARLPAAERAAVRLL